LLFNYLKIDHKAKPIKYVPKPMKTAIQKNVIPVFVFIVHKRCD
jgi:hypothetical protein